MAGSLALSHIFLIRDLGFSLAVVGRRHSAVGFVASLWLGRGRRVVLGQGGHAWRRGGHRDFEVVIGAVAHGSLVGVYLVHSWLDGLRGGGHGGDVVALSLGGRGHGWCGVGHDVGSMQEGVEGADVTGMGG